MIIALLLDLASSHRSVCQASRLISTGQLHTLLRFHTQPINVLVLDGSSGPSRGQGELVLGGASRLDAFSGYPVRT